MKIPWGVIAICVIICIAAGGIATIMNDHGDTSQQAVAQDESDVMWADQYRQAAEQGDAEAQYNLGNVYCYGYGVEQDYAKVAEWYQKSAEQGFSAAQNSLGACYALGRGVAQDDAKAVTWYQKAVEQGNADAQDHLGVCYIGGLGVEKDYTKAVE